MEAPLLGSLHQLGIDLSLDRQMNPLLSAGNRIIANICREGTPQGASRAMVCTMVCFSQMTGEERHRMRLTATVCMADAASRKAVRTAEKMVNTAIIRIVGKLA